VIFRGKWDAIACEVGMGSRPVTVLASGRVLQPVRSSRFAPHSIASDPPPSPQTSTPDPNRREP
jgi:hypothetical protein